MKKDLTKPKHRRLKNKSIIIGVVSVLVVAGVGSVTYMVLSRNDPFMPREGASEILDERSVAQQQADALFYSALDDSQRTAEASEGLVRLMDESELDEDKAVYLSTLASLYEYAGDYNAALEYANRLEETVQSDTSAATVASVHFAMGNYGEAARFYQLAADRSEPMSDPTQASPYNDYMNSKREAEERVS